MQGIDARQEVGSSQQLGRVHAGVPIRQQARAVPQQLAVLSAAAAVAAAVCELLQWLVSSACAHSGTQGGASLWLGRACLAWSTWRRAHCRNIVRTAGMLCLMAAPVCCHQAQAAGLLLLVVCASLLQSLAVRLLLHVGLRHQALLRAMHTLFAFSTNSTH